MADPTPPFQLESENTQTNEDDRELYDSERTLLSHHGHRDRAGAPELKTSRPWND